MAARLSPARSFSTAIDQNLMFVGDRETGYEYNDRVQSALAVESSGQGSSFLEAALCTSLAGIAHQQTPARHAGKALIAGKIIRPGCHPLRILRGTAGRRQSCLGHQIDVCMPHARTSL